MKRLSLVFAMMFLCLATMMAQRTISGTVTDDAGEALPFANVYVEGTTVGTTTDIDGNYTLKVPEGASTIVVSYTGYGDQSLALGDSNTLNCTMSEGIALDDVIVTALGISREEKSLGYAVQEIGGEDLSNSRETNVVNSLQGKVAGVQIQGSPSTLGGSSRITIRGSSSFLYNNQPLFVVDGVPIDNSNFATSSQMRGFGGESDPYDYGNMAQDIDPENIESMTVLKGAAASALYGQRGANGVILITTKNGSESKGLGVEVNSSVGWDNATNLIPHQQEYGGGSINPNTESGFNEVNIDGTTYLYPEYAKDGAWGPRYDGTLVRHWDSWDPQSSNFGETRPWSASPNGYEEFFQTGVTMLNSVALSGGNELGSFRLGYSNTNQTGTLPNGKLQRNGVNFNSQYKLHKRLRVGLTGNYVRTDAENRNITGYNNGNPMQAFTQWWQTQLDVDRLKENTNYTDGSQYTWNAVGPQVDDMGNLLYFESAPKFFDNPYWVRENYLQEDVRNRFYGNATATANIAEGLDLTGRLGTDFYQFSSREGIPIASVETASYGETERRFQENNLELRLNYGKTFGDISLNAALGGNNMRQLSRRTSGSSVGGLSLEGFFNLSNSKDAAELETDEQQRGINSVFGTASIGYKSFLYLDLTARNDWSSTLPKGSNSYFYPSASLSAVISDIPGVDLGLLSFAKVRVSYAQVGNDAPPYSLIDVYEPIIPNFGNYPRYNIPNERNNSELKPELTSEYEVGIDLRFWNNRLGFDVAYFDRTTVDQIYPVPVSASTGYTSRLLNAGEMRNWGWEFMITGTPVKTDNFSWDLGLNFYRQNNKVVELNEGVESISRGGTWAADLRIAKDYPYMAVFGQDYIRENYEEDDEGNIIRNEGSPTVDEDGYYRFTNQRVFLGSAIADWTGGFSTSLNFKGITAGALFDFQKGGVVHSTTLQWAKYSGMLPETVEYNGQADTRENGMILDGVFEDGTPNNVAVNPQSYYQGYWNRAAPNVYDASFLKLREVRLGYSLPKSLLGDKIRDVNISFYGRNLAVLASALPYLDPQIITGAGNDQGLENAQVPSTRSFGANLRFKF